MSNQKDDLEAGSSLLYPLMQESPELRWSFIRKVYSILAVQLLATIGFAALVASVHPIASFFRSSQLGVSTYVVVVITPLIVMWFLYIYRNKHPANFILLGVFTLFFGFALGIASTLVSGAVVLESVIATAVVVMSLTAYTFWASKRGQDFSFLAPFLLSTLVILITFSILQIFYPMGETSEMLHSGLYVIIFSAYIIYDTQKLIKRYSYDDYIWASISLYLDVLNLFLNLLNIVRGVNR